MVFSAFNVTPHIRVKKVYFTLTIRPVHSKMRVYAPVAQLYRAIAS